jgi:cation diffusion facilitator CzcD-associated flavoprotein CzcO
MKELLIIGAGPYGLATAAYAKHLGIDFAVLGKPMEFWRHSMPKGMFLRSGSTWHVDPVGVDTLEAFLKTKDLTPEEVDPIPVEVFVEYVDWFVKRVGIQTIPSYARNLEVRDGRLEAFIESGEVIAARNVLAAPGLSFFQNIPADLVAKLPRGHFTHTCSTVNFEPFRGRRCLIIGGRQSAFEWAALMAEAGVAQMHVSYRHDTPQFAPSDWSWVDPMMQLTTEFRGWYRKLPAAEKETIENRFWAEGRLKLEPWLASRIDKPNIELWPKTSVEACEVSPGGSLSVRLSGRKKFEVDHIILATGYRVNVNHVSFLSKTTVLPRLKILNGFPALDEDFQTAVKGLFLAGLVATNDFGPFYGFVRGCPTAARIIGDHIQAHLS